MKKKCVSSEWIRQILIGDLGLRMIKWMGSSSRRSRAKEDISYVLETL